MDADTLRTRVAALDWYHSIDLGRGIVTPGMSKNVVLSGSEFPDVAGKSVLDVGAWDGFYSFLAEQRGAARVVAFDEYAWCLDFHARQRYWDESDRAGLIPDYRKDEDFYDRDQLPGRRPFELAKEALDSKVEPLVGDLLRVDPGELGVFDVVLYLGVLYHMPEPLTALQRLRAVTADGGTAVIETEAVAIPDHEDEALGMFWAGKELNEDFGNWWALSEPALHGLCRAAGFRTVETRRAPEPTIPMPELPRPWARPQDRRNYTDVVEARREIHRYRIVVHAHA